MSSFWKGSSSESESESSEDERGQAQAQAPASRFMVDSDSDSEEERVVRSAKDKRWDELNVCIKSLRNSMRIGDWATVVTDFEKLNKQLQKSKNVVAKDGAPKVYIKVISDLSDAVEKQLERKDEVKRMKTAAAKALNAMKQRIRKNNKLYEKEIEAYKQSAEESEDDDGSEDSSEEETSEEESGSEGDTETDSDEDSDSDSDSDSDDDQGEQDRASKWLKKDEPTKAKPAVKTRERVQRAPKEKAEKVVQEPKEKKIELTEEAVEKQLREIIMQRGRRAADKKEQIESLERLLQFTNIKTSQAAILLHLISLTLDSSQGQGVAIATQPWRASIIHINALLDVFDSDPSVEHAAMPNVTTSGTAAAAAMGAAADSEDEGNEDGDKNASALAGSVLGFTERLDRELYKALQQADAVSGDLSKRLLDKEPIVALLRRVYQRYSDKGEMQSAARLVLRLVQHHYYIHDDILAQAGKEAGNSFEQLDQWVNIVYEHGDDKMRTQALLCSAFHLALHDRFYEARDLILSSRVQESIGLTDPNTMIMHNRAMAMLGLAALRCGEMDACQQCLGEIFGNNRQREILAQGVSMRFERSAEEQRQDRLRLLPQHLHINIECLEVANYIASLVIDVPNNSSSVVDGRRRPPSKALRRALEQAFKQALHTPAESTKDRVVAAARAMAAGDWEECCKQITGISSWKTIAKTDEISERIQTIVREATMQSFLIAFAPSFDSISLDALCARFKCQPSRAYAQVSGMIVRGELRASWDDGTKSLVMHRAEPNRLQQYSLVLAERIQHLVDANERTLDLRFGNHLRSNEGGFGGFQNRHHRPRSNFRVRRVDFGRLAGLR